MNHSSKLLAAISVLLGFTSCATTGSDRSEDSRLQRDLDREATFVTESGYSYWRDPGPSAGELSVTINLAEQTAYAYRGETVVGRSRVATGKRSHRTPAGQFSVMEKVVDKRSNLYGKIFDESGNVVEADADTRRHSVPPGGRFVGAPMPNWMRLTSSGIGMHVGPIPNPGKPASHGCIRMPRPMAERFFEAVAIGTPVEIVRR